MRALRAREPPMGCPSRSHRENIHDPPPAQKPFSEGGQKRIRGVETTDGAFTHRDDSAYGLRR